MNKKWLWLLLFVAITGAGYRFFIHPAEQSSPGKKPDQRARSVPVQAAFAERGNIDVTINALGTVTARNTAIVKARVAGQLTRIAFREGQLVKEGETLAEIDPRPFRAELDQAAGQLARDQAMLANARTDLKRYRILLKKDSIAGQQVDNQEWLVRQYEGTVKNDQGIVESARLQLDFTRITAPFTGRIGLRQVDVGNYVQTSDPNGIIVLTQTQPINIVFAIPADKLATVVEHLRAGETLTVDAYDRIGATLLASGKVLTIDNQIDVATNTVKLKAEFTNNDETLFPNQFVNARLRVETKHDAILIPVAAIQHGTRDNFVYVIGKDQTVTVRTVTPGPASAGQIAIEHGLEEGEQVVIDGTDKLREGTRVEVLQPDGDKTTADIPEDSPGIHTPGTSGNEHRHPPHETAHEGRNKQQ